MLGKSGDAQSSRSDNSADTDDSSYELDMYYHFGHIVLYRPFLHYLAKAKGDKGDNTPDHQQLGYALQCINAAQSAVSRSERVLLQGYLSPASWACAYTVFLSVVCLIFFLASHSESRQAAMIRQAVESGIRIMASTSCQDTGSRRCLDVIRVSRESSTRSCASILTFFRPYSDDCHMQSISIWNDWNERQRHYAVRLPQRTHLRGQNHRALIKLQIETGYRRTLWTIATHHGRPHKNGPTQPVTVQDQVRSEAILTRCKAAHRVNRAKICTQDPPST